MEDLTSVSEPLYEARLAIVGISDFGYPLEALTSGSAPPPPGGARFDAAFEGPIEGRRLAGAVSGVDYVSVRADGRMELHIHARIVASDGAPLSFRGGGIAILDPGSGLLQLYENVILHSSDPRYTWVNGLPIWARGTVDLARGEIRVAGFTSSGLVGPIPAGPAT